MKGKQIYFPDVSEKHRQLRRIKGVELNEKPLVDSKTVWVAFKLLVITVTLMFVIAYYGNKYGW